VSALELNLKKKDKEQYSSWSMLHFYLRNHFVLVIQIQRDSFLNLFYLMEWCHTNFEIEKLWCDGFTRLHIKPFFMNLVYTVSVLKIMTRYTSVLLESTDLDALW